MLKNKLNNWVPGLGISSGAITRLQNHFHSHPEQAVGEAWFLGENRRIYQELLTEDLSTISQEKMSGYLWGIGSGISCFDDGDQFIEWFDYLMVRINLNGSPHDYHYVTMIEDLFECIYAAYPQQLPEEIRVDLLSTVGEVLMQDLFWHEGQFQNQVAYYCYLPYLFTGVLLFNVKYRKPDEISTWIESLCAIKCVKWRSYILLWFVGLIEIFEGRFKTLNDFMELTNFNLGHYLKKESLTVEEYFQKDIIQYENDHYGVQQARQGKPIPLLGLNLCFNTTLRIPIFDWFSADTLSSVKYSISQVLTQDLLNAWLEDFKKAPGRHHETLLDDLESYPQMFRDYYFE